MAKKKSTTAITTKAAAQPIKPVAVKARSLGFVQVPMDYSNAEQQRAIFANSFVVQHDQHEFHLMFFQTNPPLLIGGDPDIEKKIREIKSIKPECVARIVMSADRIQEVIRALQDNHSKHQTNAKQMIDIHSAIASEAAKI